MGKRSVSIAWKVYLVYGMYIVVFGILLLVAPRMFAEGEFESFTSAIWTEFAQANAEAASFIELVYRSAGCMVLLVGIFTVFVALYPYRKAEAWSWWAALIVGVTTWGYMLLYTLIIGEIGPLVLGAILFLIAIVLPAKTMLSKSS
ncbi:hypothetical protein CEE34_09025 [Candidatus Aerophobetes bacterium Ae_b3a]|nr:MAG: hypothetical protein CEE34_09025 [Candidatus Aerophobetes bacterium Ae_b3a]